jgi:Xaa-Pro dipeptidase
VVKKLLSSLVRRKRVGVNAIGLSFSTYERLKRKYHPKKMTDVSKALLDTRLVKDEVEIGRIREAARITKTAMREIQKYFETGITELELAARFDFIQMTLGASGTSFDTVVSFGKNSALPHHSPDMTKLKNGDIILIDAGAKYENYCSDITRTFLFGKKGGQQAEMVDIVKEAQKRAIDAIMPGKEGREIHELAAKYLDEVKGGKYKGKFIHALGHSVGLETHDGPGLSSEKNILAPGMVVTVEPGVYVTGFGGVRFEDDVLITKEGCEIL